MIDIRKLAKRLLFPPVPVLLLLTVVSAAALVLIFLNGMDMHVLAYPVYVLSAYTVTVLTLYFVKVFPKTYASIKEKLYTNKWTKRYLTDVAFKTHVLLYVSLTANVLYALANALFAILYQTAWFGIFAGYYLLLAAMRFLLLRYVNRHGILNDVRREWKRARACAYVLALINVSLSFAILMVMEFGRGFDYPGILIYVMAMYTFYMTTITIIHLVRYRRHGSPIMTTTKIVTMAAAMISMLALETAMLHTFGAETDRLTQNILIAATGAGISATIIGMSVYMILRATKEIRRIDAQADKETHE